MIRATIAATMLLCGFADVTPRPQKFSVAGARLSATLRPSEKSVCSMDLTKDGRRLVTLSTDGTAVVWDVRSWKRIKAIEGAFWSDQISITADGKTVLGLARNRQSLRIFDVESGAEIHTLALVWAGSSQPFSLSPDGTRVAISQQDRSIHVFDVRSGEEKSQIATMNFGSVAWSPDGKLIALVGWDGRARAYDVEKSEEAFALDGRQDRNATVQFAPDSKSLLSVGKDYKVRQFECPSGKEMTTFPDAITGFRAVTFLPGGKLVAGGDGAGVLHIWDRATGKEMARMTTEQGSITCLRMTPDERFMITGGTDGSVKAWGESGAPRSVPVKRREGKPGYLGVRPGGDDADVKGVPLGEVMADSPAEKAGLQANDVITKIGDRSIDTFEDLRGAVTALIEGDEVEVTLTREGAEKKIKVKVGARPEQ